MWCFVMTVRSYTNAKKINKYECNFAVKVQKKYFASGSNW